MVEWHTIFVIIWLLVGAFGGWTHWKRYVRRPYSHDILLIPAFSLAGPVWLVIMWFPTPIEPGPSNEA